MSQTYRKDNYFLSLRTPRPAIIVRAPTAKNAARRPNDNQSFQKKLPKFSKNVSPVFGKRADSGAHVCQKCAPGYGHFVSITGLCTTPPPRFVSLFPRWQGFCKSRSETRRNAERDEAMKFFFMSNEALLSNEAKKTLNDKSLKLHTL